jgi:FKBP-type peptidyl-prolyl cis-trans isomerase
MKFGCLTLAALAGAALFVVSFAGGPVTTPSGLVYEVVTEGSGPPAKPGEYVLIRESTSLADGTVIFSNLTADKPLKFLLGGNQVIAGVDEAVTGMRAGERRKLVVPPALSKRSKYPEGLSPDATLYYVLELVEIVSAGG